MNNKMKKGIWQNRFRGSLHPSIRKFCDSTVDDQRLVPFEIESSIAHVTMLGKKGILNRNETKKLQNGLKKLMIKNKTGKFKMRPELEDVHMNIERAIKRTNGKSGDKLHTGRSRNDLIATDLRLYARESVLKLIHALTCLQKRLLEHAFRNLDKVIPGFTHMQPAQPITWSFYVLAYFSKFERDINCLKDALKRINVSPLGSAALAGTSHNIDIDFTASLLGFSKVAENALDAVSDRDFIIELLCICSQIAIHISSLSEDMVSYASPGQDLIELDDQISTGSSIMPQKKNPDLFELLRAKTGHAIGNLCSVLTMLKGLPSSYNRDLQEIKAVLFRQIDSTLECLDMLTIGILRIKVKEKDWIHQPSFICATDLVDYLVKQGKAFRQAYNMVADCVRNSNNNIYLFIRLCAKAAKLDENVIKKTITPYYAVKNRVTSNSTGSIAVQRALKRARKMVLSI